MTRLPRLPIVVLAVLAGLVAACATDDPAEVAGVTLEQDEDASDDDGEEDVSGSDQDDAPQEPPPEPAAAPFVLGAETSDMGVNHRFEDDGVELGGGQVLEQDPVTRHLVADALRDGEQIRCQAILHAPSDRSMIATGELTVTLVLEGRDGQVTRVTRQTFDLDADVDAGEHLELDPSEAYDVDTTSLRAVWCEAVHQPA